MYNIINLQKDIINSKQVMKKTLGAIFILIPLILSGCSVTEGEGSNIDTIDSTQPIITFPLAVTSIGQSIDLIILQGALETMQLDYACNSQLTAEDIHNYNTLLVAVGSSKKGMNFANVTLDQELERIHQLNKHVKDETTIILIHMGGVNRRGVESDKLIRNSFPLADGIIVIKDGNHDCFFSDYAKEHNIWFNEIDTIKDLQPLLEALIQN
ncbi:DUF6305 family protein [Natronincola ferrireducens]|uniref:DUF6305 domain-containing protein n=1 Tax=Natronincola ferrireducens TaxID=393762 RepID=A0A1G9FRZ2_9FIRM|nr:DUF6305 family protein [Natronincola ferrireducens]SDK91196.1 hypothetical protein SAMN05660472_02230 [Natronincola ferrireducens]